MTLRYVVGIKIRNKADQMTIEAEDALIAALRAKMAHPEAAITYVRKRTRAAIDAIRIPARPVESGRARRGTDGSVTVISPDCPWHDRRDHARPSAQASWPAAWRTHHHQKSVSTARGAGNRRVPG